MSFYKTTCAVAPGRIWKWGEGHRSGATLRAPIRRQAPEKYFLVVLLHWLFWL